MSYREKAILKYGKRCQLCHGEESCGAVEVHHIDHDRSNNDMDNLMVLCRFCHKAIHSKSTTRIHAFLYRADNYPNREAKYRCSINMEDEHMVSALKAKADANDKEPEEIVKEVLGNVLFDTATIQCGKDTREMLAEYRDEHDFDNYDEALKGLLQYVKE